PARPPRRWAGRSGRRCPCRSPRRQHTRGRPSCKDPSVAAPALRPLGIGEILDVGIKIYWRNAWTLFRIVLFVVLPAQIVVGIIQVSALPEGVNTNFNYSLNPGFNTAS